MEAKNHNIFENSKDNILCYSDNESEDFEDSYPIGLDIGTKYCRIGVYRNGGVEMIPNKNGEVNTPSFITILNENEILKGEDSIDYFLNNSNNTIYDIKKFIEINFNNNKKEKKKLNDFPFEIIKDKNIGIFIIIKKNNKTIQFTLEEILSFLIRKMVDNAEDYLNIKINKLVISVPFYFDASQINYFKKAADLAGISIYKIIYEPISAALFYENEREKKIKYNEDKNKNLEEKKILIFDFGGTSLNIFILKVNPEIEIKEIERKDEKKFKILISKSNKLLGGDFIDIKLAEYFLSRFCRKFNIIGKTVKKEKNLFKKLIISCENIKRVLSSNDETTLYIHNFYEEKDIFEKITRKELEDICNDLFQNLESFIKETLAEANFNKNEIDEIILAGGSSKIPKVKNILEEFFNIKNSKQDHIKIYDSIDPEQIIAYGTTLASKFLFQKMNNSIDFNLTYTFPLSLGINIENNSKDPEIRKKGDLMRIIFKRGTKIPNLPFCKRMDYYTIEDNQEDLGRKKKSKK